MRLNLKPTIERYEIFAESKVIPAGKTEKDAIVYPAVAFMARPALTEVMENAKADDAIIEHAEEIRALLDAEEQGTADLSAMIRAKGRAGVLLSKAIARAVIESWEGIEDPDGSPAPVTPDRIDAFMDVPEIYNRFTEVYLARWLVVQYEKNASAPSPTGTSAAAKPIARRARGSAKPAPAKRTPRKQ